MSAKKNSVSDLSELFDVLIINLASETDRRQSSIHEVAKLGLTPKFIVAEKSSDTAHLKNGFLRSGASACFASHLKAWQEVSKSTKKYTIVTEDDLFIRDDKKFVETLQLIASSSLDIVQLGFLKTGFRQIVDVKLQNLEISLIRVLNLFFGKAIENKLRVKRNVDLPRIFVADDFRAGAHCYVLTAQSATRLLSKSSSSAITLDAYLMALSWHQAFRVARVKRSLADQKDFPSQIKFS